MAGVTAPNVQEPHRIWSARISSAYNIWRQRGQPLSQQLEDSLSGIFPQCVQGASTIAPDTTGMWNYANADQVNYNLNLAAVQYMIAQCWDEFPTLHFSTRPLNVSEDLVLGNERVAQIIMDDGDSAAEFRMGMESSMCRGPLMLFFGIGGETPVAGNVAAMGVPAAEVVEAVMRGEAVTLSKGMNFEAISVAARSLAGDPVKSGVLGIQVTTALMDLAQKADLALAEEMEKSPKYERTQVWFQACPYGTWGLWDPMVSDHRKAAWIARKLVYDDEEFQACEAFSAKAKREVKPIEVGTTDGWGSVKYAEMSPELSGIENKRFVIWEIWDKRHWERHYIAEGYDGFLEDDATNPYTDQHGKPLLPGFFPCVIRTPIRSPRERPESSWGIAQLAPGWPMQIEFIKFESRAINSLKQTARIYVAGPSVSDEEFEKVRSGVDCTIVRLKPGVKEEQRFDKLPFDTPAPKDYQDAAVRCMFRYATAVRVPSVAFTGEPIADTLGQEQIALQGSTVTQADITRQYESAYAEAAWCALKLFRAYAPEEQVQAYLGPQSTLPRQQPVEGPDGQAMLDPATGQPQMQEMPSLWEEWKSMSLDGHKFQARFSSSTRAEDAVAQKLSMDYLMALRGGTTTMGTRIWDEKDTMSRIAKQLDQPEPKPYEMSMAEKAAMVMASAGAGVGGEKKEGEDRKGPSGERTDTRTAGGNRGTGQGITNRQERHEAPGSRSQMHGQLNRAARGKS